MVYWRDVCVVLSLLVFVVVGDTTPCRYERNYCSCKLGSTKQGRCWDVNLEKPSFCRQRFCDKGWTCACAGRSHLCQRSAKLVNTVADENQRLIEAPCTKQIQHPVTAVVLKLGEFLPMLSRNGMANDECSRFTWWHNGLFRGDWDVIGGIENSKKTKIALNQRGVHTLLELKAGDLIAFRLSQASYYCYNHFSALQVNGLNITTSMNGVTTHYARQFSESWFHPSFVLNETNIGLNESESDLTKFLQPRVKMLDDNETEILPKVDYWSRDEGASEDTRKSDWFWRIQIPRNLIAPNTASF